MPDMSGLGPPPDALVPKTCGVPELMLRQSLSECTTLDLQASLVNSNTTSTTAEQLHALSQLLVEGTARTPRLRELVVSGLPLADDGAELLAPLVAAHPGLLALRMESCGLKSKFNILFFTILE